MAADIKGAYNFKFNTAETSKKGIRIQGFNKVDSVNDHEWSGIARKGSAYKYDSVRFPSYGTYDDGSYYIFVKGEKYWYKVNSISSSGAFTVPKGATRYYAYDTGGYTGSWGPEGRLAMLHQKEIVLNAHDTENFLAAVEIVRGISDQIEKNAMVMRSNNEFANYKTQVKPTNETLQQEVTIHAEFPNATDHNEIEEAFRNLTNLASQYTNRKF